jgi:hypothetical protein
MRSGDYLVAEPERNHRRPVKRYIPGPAERQTRLNPSSLQEPGGFSTG